MNALLWWNNITLETPIRDIGWTWVILALLIIFIWLLLIRLGKEMFPMSGRIYEEQQRQNERQN